jgi:DNA ligase-1
MHCVESVRPKRVITIHGYTREFATELRSHGYEAWSAHGNDQLEFHFNRKSQIT